MVYDRRILERLCDGLCEPCTIAITAATLGVVLGGSLCVCIAFPDVDVKLMATYVASLALFHLLEFIIEASNHPRTVEMSSFMIPHSMSYAAANAASLAEAILTRYFFGTVLTATYFRQLGLVALIVGQVLRSAAMRQAGPSFTHQVMEYKRDCHTLITCGVYSRIRHPAYMGYFWFVVGSQMLLGNVVCLVTHTVVTNLFLHDRIDFEEKKLAEFFGHRYLDYVKGTAAGVPFAGYSHSQLLGYLRSVSSDRKK